MGADSKNTLDYIIKTIILYNLNRRIDALMHM